MKRRAKNRPSTPFGRLSALLPLHKWIPQRGRSRECSDFFSMGGDLFSCLKMAPKLIRRIDQKSKRAHAF